MRLLLDECMPRRLRAQFPGHDVSTTQEAGFAGKKNGELLRAAAGKFDAFLTVDKNLVFQQDVKALPFAVVVLVARSNRYGDLAPLAPAVLKALLTARPGQVLRVGA